MTVYENVVIEWNLEKSIEAGDAKRHQLEKDGYTLNHIYDFLAPITTYVYEKQV